MFGNMKSNKINSVLSNDFRTLSADDALTSLDVYTLHMYTKAGNYSYCKCRCEDASLNKHKEMKTRSVRPTMRPHDDMLAWLLLALIC